mgnify:CR=1 FL=1
MRIRQVLVVALVFGTCAVSFAFSDLEKDLLKQYYQERIEADDASSKIRDYYSEDISLGEINSPMKPQDGLYKEKTKLKAPMFDLLKLSRYASRSDYVSAYKRVKEAIKSFSIYLKTGDVEPEVYDELPELPEAAPSIVDDILGEEVVTTRPPDHLIPAAQKAKKPHVYEVLEPAPIHDSVPQVPDPDSWQKKPKPQPKKSNKPLVTGSEKAENTIDFLLGGGGSDDDEEEPTHEKAEPKVKPVEKKEEKPAAKPAEEAPAVEEVPESPEEPSASEEESKPVEKLAPKVEPVEKKAEKTAAKPAEEEVSAVEEAPESAEEPSASEEEVESEEPEVEVAGDDEPEQEE